MNKGESGQVVLYLMRHGQTILNKGGRTQGWCDGVLTKEGIEVARNVGVGLKDIEFKSFYSSDLGRAIKTAKIVIKENIASKNSKLIEVEELREVCFGKYEGELEKVKFNDTLKYLKVSSLKEAEEKYHFQRAYCDACASLDETKMAEDYDTAINRVIKAIEKICVYNLADNGGNVLIVIHGGILRLFIEYVDKTFNIRNMDNSSISKIIYNNGKFTVESVNDTSYNEVGKNLRKNK